MEPKQNITIPEMMQKLDDMYKRQNEIITKAQELRLEYNQLEEDADLLKMMIMHQSNRVARKK